MFIASRVVSLVVPLPLCVCLAFTCVMFIASLVVSLVVPYHCESALRFLLRRKKGAEQDRVFLGRGDGVMMESSVSVLRAGL